MQISPICSKSKTDLVSETIVEQILNKSWKAGEKIPGENELAAMFNVSRTSIRQAISQLVGKGILSIKRGEGTYVNEILPKDFFGNLRQLFIMEIPKYLEVQEFRKIIEPSIAYYAAIKAEAKDIEALEKCVKKQMEYASKGNFKSYAKEDLKFHKLLADCVKNGMIQKTFDILWELMDCAMEYTTIITGTTNGVEFHRKICDCIRKRDQRSAFHVMEEHIENNIKAIREKEELMHRAGRINEN